MHGYALVQEYERQQVADWATVSRPHVYYALNKLAARGLVEAPGHDAGRNGRARVVFRPSRSGRTALARALADEHWAAGRAPSPFITWLALSIHADVRARRRLIAARREFLRLELAKERATLEEVRQSSGARDQVATILVSLAIEQLDAELRCLERLEF
jgi:DNA-binding PadR family transcriptional regulator